MIETRVINYLTNKLGVSVTTEVPKSKSEFVTIRKIDGGRVNYIDVATLSIESTSTSLFKAAELDKRVRDAMFEMVSEKDISGVNLGGNSSDNDTTSKRYAYESIFNIFYFE